MSACIRRSNGTILHQIGDHQQYWHLEADAPSTRDNIYVPINNGQQQWGTVELCFANQQGFAAAVLHHPIVLLGIFMVCVNGLIFRWYMMRAFNYLDPSRSVPMHVRSTLDTFSEGVVVLDKEQRIVLANDKFRQHIGKSDQELLGQEIDDLPWQDDSDEPPTSRWQADDSSSEGMRLGLQLDQDRRTFLVNASPILGSNGERRGTIASFDDITPLEQKREELSNMLNDLRSSRDELTLRNKELQYLATRDPLTGCLNRRSFFEIFDKQWNVAHRQQQLLSCLMVDIDHFKSVNDNHGHSVGDEVLRSVALTIQTTARDSDVLCRYGGEEFCVLLPQSDTDQAFELAERIRRAVGQLEIENLSVTASLGVSTMASGVSNPQELLDQADKCLYIAKRVGRNQVIRWDEIPGDMMAERSDERDVSGSSTAETYDASIPYPAVASLLSALAYRDADTARPQHASCGIVRRNSIWLIIGETYLCAGNRCSPARYREDWRT